MPSPPTTYLLTGANRGIGRGLANIILSRPNTTLVVLVRDPTHPTVLSLASQASSRSSPSTTNLIILPYSATSPTSAASAITTLRTDHAITALDVVIANAGAMHGPPGPVEALTPESITSHIAVNCTSTVLILQAVLPLLRAARDRRLHDTRDSSSATSDDEPARKYEPKFIAISSAIGSTALVGQHMHAQMPGYGLSKAALNWVVRKAWFEVKGEGVCVELLTPGPVRTDLTREFSLEGIPKETVERMLQTMKPVELVCEGLMKCIDTASIETTGGGFRNWKGEVVAW